MGSLPMRPATAARASWGSGEPIFPNAVEERILRSWGEIVDGQVASRKEAFGKAAAAFEGALVGVGVDENAVGVGTSGGGNETLPGESEAVVLAEESHEAFAMRRKDAGGDGPGGPGLEGVFVEAGVGPGG